jgi:hypothetical protein
MRTLHRLILSLALIAGVAPAFAQVPPPVPALPDTERRTTYSITASLCTCGVGFQLYGDSTDVANWLEVFVNGVKITQSGNWTITSPTGSLATIPRPITDAVLTFTAAQTGTVQIVGARRPRRASQFTTQPSARDFNQVLTDIIAQNRETWDKTNDVSGRVPQAPPGETMALLPVLASRANMGACFDSGGNLTSCVAATSGTIAAGNGIAFSGANPTTISADIAAGLGLTFTGTHPISIASTYTASGTGAATVAVPSKLTPIVTPEDFDATNTVCAGVIDAGPVIQRAINSTAGPVRVMLSPRPCVYNLITGVTWIKSGVSIIGAGQGTTEVRFNPTSDGLTALKGDGSAGVIYETHLDGFSIVSADTTHIKTAINLIDNSSSLVENITISRIMGDNSTFTGGAGGSFGLKTNGRDLTTFRKLNMLADHPIYLGVSPSFAQLSTDHYRFQDIYMVALAAFPCIEAQSGIAMTTPSFRNISGAGCSYGFFFNDVSAAVFPSYNIVFDTFRFEQTNGGVTSYDFFININGATNLRGLTIANGFFDSGHRGMFLRNVQSANIIGNYATCTAVGGDKLLDNDNTNDNIQLVANKWLSSCTGVTTGGTPLTMMWSKPPATGESTTVPGDGAFFSSASAVAALAYFFRTVGTTPLPVASLQTCNAANKGARSFVTDSNVAMAANFGGIIGSGGANQVPVVCDGTNWRIGANDNIPVYLRRKIG